jgi:dipeptidyl aminopeptidase/acylaminoacyl peptidase
MPGPYAAASPVYNVSPDDPPTLLVYGRSDRLIPPSQAHQLAAALDRAGVPHLLVPVQAGHRFGLRVDGRDLVPEILDFLRSVWND